MNKRQIIERALDKVITPLSVSTRPGVGLLRARLEKLGDEPLKPGEATNLLRECTPQEHRLMGELYARRAEAEDWGKHATDTSEQMLSRMGAHPVVGTLLDGLDTDVLTKQLIERRGGSDDTRPLPALTRADFISAAIDAHSTGD